MSYNMYPGTVHLLITFDNKKYKNLNLLKDNVDSDQFASVFMNYNRIRPHSVEITNGRHDRDQSGFISVGGAVDKKTNIGEFAIEHLFLWENVLDQAHIISFFENLNSV